MQNYPTKQQGSKHYHGEFNDSHGELMNAIKTSGQTLSQPDNHQLSRAIFYIGNPLWSVGGASGNDITLGRDGLPIEELRDGYAVSFIPNAKNTGATNLNVQGLGARPLKLRGNPLENGTLMPDVPVTAIYGNNAWNIVAPTEVPSLRDVMDGFVPHRPYHSLSEDKPADVSTGMFWEGYPSGKLWFDSGANGDIPVSLDGSVPSGLNDDDLWLDASKYPYELNKVGDEEAYFDKIGDGGIHHPYNSNNPEMIENGDFFYDDAGHIKYRSRDYGDIPVSLDGDIPNGLADGQYYLDYSSNPPMIRKKTPSGTEAVQALDKCCNPLDQPENALQSDNNEAPTGLKKGDYWISDAGQLMRVVGDNGESVPVSEDGSRPNKANGNPLEDGDIWLNEGVYPPIVNQVKNGEDVPIDSSIGATTTPNGEDAQGNAQTGDKVTTPKGDVDNPWISSESQDKAPPEAEIGDYYKSANGVLGVKTEEDGDGLPASTDGTVPMNGLDGQPLNHRDYIDMSQFPPEIMRWDESDSRYTPRGIRFLSSKTFNGIRRLHSPTDNAIKLAMTSSIGMQVKDGKETPFQTYSPNILEYGQLMNVTRIKDDRDKTHKVNSHGIYYENINGNKEFGRVTGLAENNHGSFNVACGSDIYGCYYLTRPSDDYTLKYSHLNDKTVLAVKDDYSDAKVINTKWENECYSLDEDALRNVNQWQTVDLTMFPHKDHLSRLAIGKFTMIALYESNLWATGYNIKDGQGFYLTPDKNIRKFDKFSQITTCGKVVDVQILGNGCVAYLNSDSQLYMAKMTNGVAEDYEWLIIEDICYIIDGSYAISTTNRVLNLRTLEYVNDLYVFPNGDKIFGYYGNDSVYAKWIYRQDVGGYYNLQDKVWIFEDKFNQLACDTFPFVDMNEASFTDLDAILYDMLYHAMIDIRLHKCVNQVRLIDYGGTKRIIGLIKEINSTKLIAYMQIPKMEHINRCKVLSGDEIYMYDLAYVKRNDYCDISIIANTDLYLGQNIFSKYSGSGYGSDGSNGMPTGSNGITCCC